MVRKALAGLALWALLSGHAAAQIAPSGAVGPGPLPTGSLAGTAAAPSITVGGVQSGLYIPSATTLGVSVAGTLRFDYNLTNSGYWTATGNIAATGNILAGASSQLGVLGKGVLTSSGAGNFQLGISDGAAPVAQSITAQSVVAGTSNTAGVNWTLVGSKSTGSGTSGDIIFQTGGSGAGATVQNAAVTALTLKGATQLVLLNAITSDATHTDASVCEDTTTHALYSGSGTLGICLGTSSARFKHAVRPLSYGLGAVMALQPISYKLNADHGDPNKTLLGFTAEQMRPVVPELVGLDGAGRPNSADYIGLIPILVRAVQEQQAEIEALRAQLDRQSPRLADLER
jgi:hypothetical protein